MLSKKEVTGDDALPFVEGKHYMLLFKTWNCSARTPYAEEDENVEPVSRGVQFTTVTPYLKLLCS